MESIPPESDDDSSSPDCAMVSFPTEIIEQIIKPLPHNDHLAMRKVNRRFENVVTPRVRTLTKSNRCEISKLKIFVLGVFCNFIAKTVNVESAQHFVQLDGRVRNRRRRSTVPNEIICVVEKVHQTNSHIHGLFGDATIGSLEMNRHFPLHLDGGRLPMLTRVLSGSTVERVELLLDMNTMTMIPQITQFLASVSCKSVSFLFQMKSPNEMIANFNSSVFASNFASAGVQEVSFSYVGNCVRNQVAPAGYLNRKVGGDVAFQVIFNLVRAGIKRVTIGRNAAWNVKPDNRPSGLDFEQFLQAVSMIPGPLFLYIDTDIAQPYSSIIGQTTVNGATMTCVVINHLPRVSITRE